jgi:hypothetical protein
VEEEAAMEKDLWAHREPIEIKKQMMDIYSVNSQAVLGLTGR